jgi:CheY-like chemotaxis protein
MALRVGPHKPTAGGRSPLRSEPSRIFRPQRPPYNQSVADSHAPQPTATSESAMSQSNKILIADDNQPNCELLEAYLADLDCQIEMAADGQETLEKAASFQPDLILLDVMMPKLSGFEVCKKLKQNPDTRRIMILMVTALNESGDIERGVEAGTDDFLSKPVIKIELLKRVENMLKLKDVQDEVERLRQYIQKMEDTSGP